MQSGNLLHSKNLGVPGEHDRGRYAQGLLLNPFA